MQKFFLRMGHENSKFQYLKKPLENAFQGFAMF